MKRVTVSLSEQTALDLQKLSEGIGCSRSALVEVLLSECSLPDLLARLQYQARTRSSDNAYLKRYSGESIREIEETIYRLKTDCQGELWDAAN